MEDGGDREGHEEDPTQDAAQSHNLPRDAPRHHVPISHCGHGDDGPPVGSRDAGELLRGAHFVLDQVQQGGVQCNGHTQEEEEKSELPRAAARRQAQSLQAQRMPSQPHHIEDAQRPQDT